MKKVRLECAWLEVCPCTHKWPFFNFSGIAKCKLCECRNIVGRVVKPDIVTIREDR